MLKKSRRLNTAEVKEVLEKGKSRGRGDALSLKYLDFKGYFKCSAVVSKKVAGSAVERNRLRRMVYAALLNLPLPPSGHAIVFVQRSVPRGHGLGVFAKDLTKLLGAGIAR